MLKIIYYKFIFLKKQNPKTHFKKKENYMKFFVAFYHLLMFSKKTEKFTFLPNMYYIPLDN